MVEPWTGDPADECRGRQGDTGARKFIQWTSKAWTAFELKLPVFYRESLARPLALDRYRDLIETNITAGITLYTDHMPGLFENSLSNKGQLSAWRLLETSGAAKCNWSARDKRAHKPQESVRGVASPSCHRLPEEQTKGKWMSELQ
jgi:hypothetical protein